MVMLPAAVTVRVLFAIVPFPVLVESTVKVTASPELADALSGTVSPEA